MFIYGFIALIPTIFEFIIIIAFTAWLLRSLYTHFRAYGVNGQSVLAFADPHKQSFLYFGYSWLNVLVFIILLALLYRHYTGIKITADGYVPSSILNNMFVYLPNYFMHEAGHNFWGKLLGVTSREGWAYWWVSLNGNLPETLVPIVIYWLAVRLKGGNLFTPAILYWISTTFYGAGVYASDARSSLMKLVSSDMVSNFGAGTKGDWYYILAPFNMLDYDIVIGNIFIFFACLTLLLAVYSAYFYIKDLFTGPLYKDDGRNFKYIPPESVQNPYAHINEQEQDANADADRRF